jgi:hypothetical protein
MAKKDKLENRPVLIRANGRPVAYIGRFSPFWLIRWFRRLIWGKRP